MVFLRKQSVSEPTPFGNDRRLAIFYNTVNHAGRQPSAGSPHPSSFVRHLILCISPLLNERATKCVVFDVGEARG